MLLKYITNPCYSLVWYSAKFEPWNRCNRYANLWSCLCKWEASNISLLPRIHQLQLTACSYFFQAKEKWLVPLSIIFFLKNILRICCISWQRVQRLRKLILIIVLKIAFSVCEVSNNCSWLEVRPFLYARDWKIIAVLIRLYLEKHLNR